MLNVNRCVSKHLTIHCMAVLSRAHSVIAILNCPKKEVDFIRTSFYRVRLTFDYKAV